MCLKSPTKSVLAQEENSDSPLQSPESKFQTILTEFKNNFKDRWLPSLSTLGNSPANNSDDELEESKIESGDE